MKVRAKKDCYMENTGEKVFSKGKTYNFVRKSKEGWIGVNNDDGDLHYIFNPGDEFFDEYFEVVK